MNDVQSASHASLTIHAALHPRGPTTMIYSTVMSLLLPTNRGRVGSSSINNNNNNNKCTGNDKIGAARQSPIRKTKKKIEKYVLWNGGICHRNSVKNCFLTQNFTEIGQSGAELWQKKRFLKWGPSAILNFKKFHIWSYECNLVPNMHLCTKFHRNRMIFTARCYS